MQGISYFVDWVKSNQTVRVSLNFAQCKLTMWYLYNDKIMLLYKLLRIIMVLIEYWDNYANFMLT